LKESSIAATLEQSDERCKNPRRTFCLWNRLNAMNLLRTAASLGQLEIPLMIVDQKNSPLPEKVKAEFPQVSVAVIEVMKGPNRRADHEQRILTQLREFSIDWCFLAGYMRLIGPTLLNEYKTGATSRIVNIHPSLLPKYPGLHAYEQAFEAGDLISGVTIHFVDDGLDSGPVILQGEFQRLQSDDLESFIERGKKLEWSLYSRVLTQLNDAGDIK